MRRAAAANIKRIANNFWESPAAEPTAGVCTQKSRYSSIPSAAVLVVGGFLLGRFSTTTWDDDDEDVVHIAHVSASSHLSRRILGLFTPLEANSEARSTSASDHKHTAAATPPTSSSLLPPTATPATHLPSSTTSNSTSAPLAGCLSPFFIADAAAKAAPSVVNILVQQDGNLPVGSSGSGFIVSADGTVLTNAHVILDALPPSSFNAARKSGKIGKGPPPFANNNNNLSPPPPPRPLVSPDYSSNAATTCTPQGHRSIAVTLQDGRIYDADLINYETVSDLAVLKLRADASLPVAKLGDSSRLRVGEWVLALGSPLHLQNSVSAGIVSCVDRKAVELGLAGGRTEFIQTDASINRGSSGGPLVNLSGEVIGISCMKALVADGVSFAIPIDTVRNVVRQLELNGRVIRPYIGVKLLQLKQHTVDQMRRRDPTFPTGVSGGVLIPQVMVGSPAALAGLQPGDIIVKYGGGGGGTSSRSSSRGYSDASASPSPSSSSSSSASPSSSSSSSSCTVGGLVGALEQHIGRELPIEVVRKDGKGGSVTVELRVVAEELR